MPRINGVYIPPSKMKSTDVFGNSVGVDVLEIENKDPLYNPGDIVYIIPNHKPPAPTNPTIGSIAEIDCKIIAVIQKEKPYVYSLISGFGSHIQVYHNSLVKAADKYKFYNKPKVKLLETLDVCDAGTIFVKIGEYYVNDHIGIYLHYSRVKGNSLFEPLKQEKENG